MSSANSLSRKFFTSCQSDRLPYGTVYLQSRARYGWEPTGTNRALLRALVAISRQMQRTLLTSRARRRREDMRPHPNPFAVDRNARRVILRTHVPRSRQCRKIESRNLIHSASPSRDSPSAEGSFGAPGQRQLRQPRAGPDRLAGPGRPVSRRRRGPGRPAGPKSGARWRPWGTGAGPASASEY